MRAGSCRRRKHVRGILYGAVFAAAVFGRAQMQQPISLRADSFKSDLLGSGSSCMRIPSAACPRSQGTHQGQGRQPRGQRWGPRGQPPASGAAWPVQGEAQTQLVNAMRTAQAVGLRSKSRCAQIVQTYSPPVLFNTAVTPRPRFQTPLCVSCAPLPTW